MRLLASLLLVLGLSAGCSSGSGGRDPDPDPDSSDWTPPTRPSLDAAPEILAGAGDIASCDVDGDEITAALLDEIPGTVFANGDLAYERGTVAEFAECYEPSWGRHKNRTLPVPGNHDYATDDGAAYFDYFGAKAGNRAEGWYATDLGAWRVIVLNTNCDAIGGCDAGSPQEQWLRHELAAHPAHCTLALMHHSRFSSSIHGADDRFEDLWQALYDAGADLVVSAHDHGYERFAPQTPTGDADPDAGILSIVAGTGGREHYEMGDPLPNSEVRNDDTYGILKLALHPSGFAWTFVGEPGATFTDDGWQPCH